MQKVSYKPIGRSRFLPYWQCISIPVQVFLILCWCIIGLLLLLMAVGYFGFVHFDLSVIIADSPPSDPGYNNELIENIFSTKISSENFNENWSVLLDHKDNDKANREEQKLIRKIFNEFDAEHDGSLSKSEFYNYIIGSLHFKEMFDFLDIDNDGFFEYKEMVWLIDLLLEFKVVPEFDSQQLQNLLYQIFGNVYAENNKSEFIAEILFEEIDTNNNNIITIKEYSNYLVNQEWDQYNKNNDQHIDYKEFAKEFFNTPMFKEMQEIKQQKQQNDYKQIMNKIKNINKRDMNGKQTMFKPHGLDKQINGVDAGVNSSPKRRRQLGIAIGIFVVMGVAAGYGAMYCEYYGCGSGKKCYDDNSLIDILNNGIQPISSVNVGDYVFDGSLYTQVFFVNRYGKIRAKMNKIRFGNPNYNHFLTLSPEHLLYKQDGEFAVTSGEILVGDVLYGINNYSNYNYDEIEYNYTVYDISMVYSIPIKPITNSGYLMVNGIKTSVYTNSNYSIDPSNKPIPFCDTLCQSGCIVAFSLIAFYFLRKNIKKC